MKKLALYTLLGLLLDQLLKIIVETIIPLQEEKTIIKNFFALTYVRNEGAAFSLLSGNQFFFILIAIIALFLFYHFFLKEKNLTKKETIVYALFISGVLGNLIDRILRGYVVDYLSFTLINYAYPIFNFADICIVLSTLYMILEIGKEEKHDRNNRKRKQTKNRYLSHERVKSK